MILKALIKVYLILIDIKQTYQTNSEYEDKVNIIIKSLIKIVPSQLRWYSYMCGKVSKFFLTCTEISIFFGLNIR